MLSISEEEFLNKVGDLPSVFEKTEIQIIKQQIESWKKQCGYDIPFDYETLKIKLDKIKTL